MMSDLFTRAQHCHQKGRLAEAELLYRRILWSDPQHAGAQHYLGLLALQTGNTEAAIVLMRKAIALNPAVADYHANLGVVLRRAGQTEEALASFTQALQLNPDLVNAHNHRGNLLHDQGRLEEAVASFRQVVRLKPDQAKAHYTLANALRELGRLSEAVASYQQVLRLNPGHLEAITHLGGVFKRQGRLDEAGACYERALRLQPDHYPARYNLSLLCLLQGDWPRAWPGYEYRWERFGRTRRHEDRPRWDGSPLQGKTILLYDEEDLGDTLQLIRYATLVRQRGGSVLCECQPTLLRLFKGVGEPPRLLARGDALPPFDVQAALPSLPGIFGTTLQTIPAHHPYLRAEPELVESWRQELKPLGGFQVGIAWQGNTTAKDVRSRSVPLAHFEVLAKVEGVRLVSLQTGTGADALRDLAGRFPIVDLGDRLDAGGAFTDTAAVMRNLDLVVTVDSALAHLAGALGVPVWTMVSFVPSWPWLLEREDSPWYPTMRLFRQRRLGDWGEVFKRVAAELCGLSKIPKGR